MGIPARNASVFSLSLSIRRKRYATTVFPFSLFALSLSLSFFLYRLISRTTKLLRLQDKREDRVPASLLFSKLNSSPTADRRRRRRRRAGTKREGRRRWRHTLAPSLTIVPPPPCLGPFRLPYRPSIYHFFFFSLLTVLLLSHTLHQDSDRSRDRIIYYVNKCNFHDE